MSRPALRFACTALPFIVSLFSFSANAQQFTPTRDGLTITSSGLTLEVAALREDVLRVRMWRGDAVPEDASWAVLPASRISRVGVVGEARGFRTSKLRVSVDDYLRLTIADLDGNILQKGAAPVRWDGAQFTVSEQQAPEDHFFGLGDNWKSCRSLCVVAASCPLLR
jgi:alpha-glucosidase